MLVCEKCGCKKFDVVDSRNTARSNKYLRRARVCKRCGAKFQTVEITRRHYNNLISPPKEYKALLSIKKIIKEYEGIL